MGSTIRTAYDPKIQVKINDRSRRKKISRGFKATLAFCCSQLYTFRIPQMDASDDCEGAFRSRCLLTELMHAPSLVVEYIWNGGSRIVHPFPQDLPPFFHP